MLKIRDRQRRQNHAAETAIWVLSAAADRDDHFAGGAAQNDLAYMDGRVRVVLVVDKIRAITIILCDRLFGERIDYPVAILVINEQPLNSVGCLNIASHYFE